MAYQSLLLKEGSTLPHRRPGANVPLWAKVQRGGRETWGVCSWRGKAFALSVLTCLKLQFQISLTFNGPSTRIREYSCCDKLDPGLYHSCGTSIAETTYLSPPSKN